MPARITPLTDAQARPRKLAIGTFDGVHRGHRSVIEGADTVVTFDPHPTALLRPELAPPLLTTLERKAELVGALGVEELIVINFDAEFAAQEPQQFIDSVVVDQLSAESVSVGTNFHFGRKAAGSPKLLADDGRFRTRVNPLLEYEGETVSSSLIRELIAAGDVKRAAGLLVAPFRVSGAVQHGDARGRELGFPTANVAPNPGFVLPGDGVYAAYANGTPAAVNVGRRPTFEDDGAVLVEAYLIDFDADLYGQTLNVDFVSKLRDELRFDSVDDLVQQMHGDVAEARRVLAFAADGIRPS